MQKIEHTLGLNNIFVEQLTPDEKSFSNPIVLVHGSFGGYWMWKMIASALAERGFETFALSLRGHKPGGETNLGSLVMQDYVEDVAVVVNELHLENPVIIGHSMGGLVALMYAAKNVVSAVISIDPSPPQEVAGTKPEDEVQKIPDVYNAMDAGMPTDPQEVMKALPDIPAEMLIKMKEMLGPESGSARRDRKRGISVPKESIGAPMLFVGAELGDSLPFGIPLESTRKTAEYYGGEFTEIKGATHPGIIMGINANATAQKIEEWLNKI